MINNKQSSQHLSTSLGIKILSAITCQKLILPFYHTVSNKDLPHIKHLYPVRSEQTFRKDLDFFLKNYAPIDLYQLSDQIQNGKRNRKHQFFLSFDDGLSEIYDVVVPILVEKGIPATFFLNSAFIDNKDLFYRYKASLLIEVLQTKQYTAAVLHEVKSHLHQDGLSFKEQLLAVDYNSKSVLDKLAEILEVSFWDYLQHTKPYLTAEQIKIITGKGFTIGAHSTDHPQYNAISLEEQIEQTKQSIQYIADKFNTTKNIFAFPFTDDGVSMSFFNSINSFTDLTLGAAGMKHDSVKTNLQRIPMEHNVNSVSSIIYSQYLYYLAKFPFGKNTITRK